MHKAFIGERDGRPIYLDPARHRQKMDDERTEAMAYADRRNDFDRDTTQGKKWLGKNAHKYVKHGPDPIDRDALSEGPMFPRRDDKGNSERIRAENRKMGQYGTGVDAYLSDTHLPTRKGGKGTADPIIAAAERDRLRGTRAKYGDHAARSFIKENRTTTWGEQYVKAYGSKVLRRTMNGPSGYLRYWTDPTGSEALRNVKGTGTGQYYTVEMTRGLLKMWLRLHDVMVDMGRLSDNGRSKVISELIAGMAPDGIATFRMYSKKDIQWIAKKAPKRYRDGEFGEFLRFLAK